MISANFIIKDAAYNNDDAIYNAIHYITHNHTCPLFCYGIWPPTEENIIHKFETLRANLSTFYSKTPCQQKLQHFWITFDTTYRLDFIISFIDNLALMIGKYYPTCYAIHEDQSSFHAHFVVSTTGHIPSQPFLIDSNWASHIKKIIRFAKKCSIILKEIHKNA
ncbi:hypothetical protein DXA57_13995 [Blautia sp. OF03-15BH]|uniref:hypothetical protein n=1 Tax=Blautia sp. OF03-15BH TaxID=2292287 RepID=UPI000E4C3DD5|nr:hypothetical protein [Blautia sp. OF03-15BH]RGX98902.1 hypothetical protein DXA57_13995 [Blautia sp. OF03-15BH]